MLELEARAGVHAGMLPSNAGGDVMDGVTGGVWSPEQSQRGWTAQQPWSHIDCPVLHFCVLCGRTVEPDFTRDHALKECKVKRKMKEIG